MQGGWCQSPTDHNYVNIEISLKLTRRDTERLPVQDPQTLYVHRIILPMATLHGMLLSLCPVVNPALLNRS